MSTSDRAIELAIALGLRRHTGTTIETDTGTYWAPPEVPADMLAAIHAAFAAERAAERERPRCPWHPELPGETTPCCIAAVRAK